MKNRLLIVMTIIALVLASCSNGPEHEHSYTFDSEKNIIACECGDVLKGTYLVKEDEVDGEPKGVKEDCTYTWTKIESDCTIPEDGTFYVIGDAFKSITIPASFRGSINLCANVETLKNYSTKAEVFVEKGIAVNKSEGVFGTVEAKEVIFSRNTAEGNKEFEDGLCKTLGKTVTETNAYYGLKDGYDYAVLAVEYSIYDFSKARDDNKAYHIGVVTRPDGEGGNKTFAWPLNENTTDKVTLCAFNQPDETLQFVSGEVQEGEYTFDIYYMPDGVVYTTSSSLEDELDGKTGDKYTSYTDGIKLSSKSITLKKSDVCGTAKVNGLYYATGLADINAQSETNEFFKNNMDWINNLGLGELTSGFLFVDYDIDPAGAKQNTTATCYYVVKLIDCDGNTYVYAPNTKYKTGTDITTAKRNVLAVYPSEWGEFMNPDPVFPSGEYTAEVWFNKEGVSYSYSESLGHGYFGGTIDNSFVPEEAGWVKLAGKSCSLPN